MDFGREAASGTTETNGLDPPLFIRALSIASCGGQRRRNIRHMVQCIRSFMGSRPSTSLADVDRMYPKAPAAVWIKQRRWSGETVNDGLLGCWQAGLRRRDHSRPLRAGSRSITVDGASLRSPRRAPIVRPGASLHRAVRSMPQDCRRWEARAPRAVPPQAACATALPRAFARSGAAAGRARRPCHRRPPARE